MRILPLILAAIVITLLIVSNPNREDFALFVEAQAIVLLQEHTGDTPFGQMLSELGAVAASRLVQRQTTRHNYLLFSLYRVDLSAGLDEREEWRFLGIGGQFVELHRPESLRRK